MIFVDDPLEVLVNDDVDDVVVSVGSRRLYQNKGVGIVAQVFIIVIVFIISIVILIVIVTLVPS